MKALLAVLEKPELTEPIDDQLHDTSYPGSLMLVSVKPKRDTTKN